MVVTAEQYVMVGAGGHAHVVAEALAAHGMVLAGHLAPQPGNGLGPYLGDDTTAADLSRSGHRLLLGFGFVNQAGATRRAALIEALPDDALAEALFHPAALILGGATAKPGSFVAAGAIIGVGVTLGKGVIVNTGAIIDHDSVVGNNSHIATGARLAGTVTVGANCLIGAGATIRQSIRIGDGAVIGAGAAVIRDVAPGARVLGVPAR